MKIDSLIFDLDGTLWDSSEGIVATWALVLENYPEIHKKVTAEELASNFGLPLEQIARNMFPDQPEWVLLRNVTFLLFRKYMLPEPLPKN